MKIEDISKSEDQMITEAAKQYGGYFSHAQFAVDLLDSFIKNVNTEAVFFVAFYTQVKNHIVLAFLSAIRLHYIQANFNFRYATEAGAWAAFGMAHQNAKADLEKYAIKNEDGTLRPNQALRSRMYEWFEKNYKLGNDSIEKFKGALQFSSHANIVDAYRNFNGFTENGFQISFFDKPEEHHVKTDLWAVGNLIMGLLDLFYGINKDHKVLEFQDDFLSQMAKLRDENNRLKREMMSHPRFIKYAKNKITS